MSSEKFSLDFGGKKLIIETGKLAKQAHGSCTVQYGDTVVLAAVVMGKNAKEGMSYFPLMVDFEEKLYAAGKIKGSRFIKREGRPTDEAVLSGRLIDRAIRPLFNDEIRNEIQVVVTVLCWDGENDPDFPALIAASTALSISKVPWNGPIVGLRIGSINDEWVINPSYDAQEKSDIDIMAAYTNDKKLIMLEAGAKEASEEKFQGAIEFGQKHAGKLIDLIKEVQKKVGQPKVDMTKLEDEAVETLEEDSTPLEIENNEKLVKEFIDSKIQDYLFSKALKSKAERKAKLDVLREEVDDFLKEKQVGKEKRKKAMEIFHEHAEHHITQAVLKNDQRVDGRKLTEVRNLECETGNLPRTHGSAVFSRGATQVLSVVTLGSLRDEQILDTMEEEDSKKRYMHHYNFPGYSVGEPKMNRGAGRREIGHGALAEKALMPVLPPKEDFPYAIRVVSEVMGSNGSSSMASTCGSSLALMDAGVPITKSVAGIAMGLASDKDNNWKVLSDLQDLEDGAGGMDFKIAGTKDGITAVQMDTKTLGLTMDIVKQALFQGKDARMDVLKAMDKQISKPNPELSPYAPRVYSFKINPEKIRDVIGPGGKQINEIIDATGVEIDIENDGLVMIYGIDAKKCEEAKEWIEKIVKEVEVGEIYEGKVVRIMDFGAFVEIAPKKDGMVHVSELSDKHVKKVQDEVKIGQTVKVKVIKIDDLGRVNLTMKNL